MCIRDRGGDNNQVHLVKGGKVEHWDPMTKQDVATRLIQEIAEKLSVDA